MESPIIEAVELLPKEIQDLLKLPEVIIIARKPNGRIVVTSRIKDHEQRTNLIREAYLLEITPCDESCIHKVLYEKRR